MFNLTANWRYVGNLSKVILYASNIIVAAFSLFLMLTYIPPPDPELTRGDFALMLIQMQLLFNVPVLAILNMSGLFRRSIAERNGDQDT